MYHFGDPCIHCGTPHDEVAPGPCKGDPKKAKVLEWAVVRQGWENPGSGADTVRMAMSDGTIREEGRHAAEHYWSAPYLKDATVLAPHEFRAKYARAKLGETKWKTPPNPEAWRKVPVTFGDFHNLYAEGLRSHPLYEALKDIERAARAKLVEK